MGGHQTSISARRCWMELSRLWCVGFLSPPWLPKEVHFNWCRSCMQGDKERKVHLFYWSSVYDYRWSKAFPINMKAVLAYTTSSLPWKQPSLLHSLPIFSKGDKKERRVLCVFYSQVSRGPDTGQDPRAKWSKCYWTPPASLTGLHFSPPKNHILLYPADA